jgi:hypothetical protein
MMLVMGPSGEVGESRVTTLTWEEDATAVGLQASRASEMTTVLTSLVGRTSRNDHIQDT